MNLKQVILLSVAILLLLVVRSQNTINASAIKALKAYPHKVSDKADQLEQKLDKKTAKLLQQLHRQEQKMKAKLGKIDSVRAETVFGDVDSRYKQLEEKLKTPGAQKYISSLDTMSSSLKFLQGSKLLPGEQSQKQLSEATNKVKGLEGQFQKAEDLKRFLKERRTYLKEQLGQLGFAKELKQLNKKAHYYNQQLNEYKSMLSDHKKMERKTIELLNSSKMFKDFMRKNSMLASLFRLPGDNPSSFGGAGGGSLAGLQTRTQVNNFVQQQIAAAGPDARQQFSQNIQAAQAELNQLKDKITKLGGNNSEEELPDFKPNSQKTKSFWKRIELGTNIQSQKSNGYFPVTSDIGLSAGYKLNDRSTIGIGSSYKVGWGQNIKQINITHQGVGLRSFMEWKLTSPFGGDRRSGTKFGKGAGSFWLSCGYEMNYRSEFKRIEELKGLYAFQRSGLIGLSKVVSLKAKFFKKTKLQLLWDFLSYQQMPRTQPLKFRIGYNF